MTRALFFDGTDIQRIDYPISTQGIEGIDYPISTQDDLSRVYFSDIATFSSHNEYKPIECKKIIQNNNVTIVFWEDNTKTIVKLKDGEQNDVYTAFAMAVMKKIYGGTQTWQGIVEDKLVSVVSENTKKIKSKGKNKLGKNKSL